MLTLGPPFTLYLILRSTHFVNLTNEKANVIRYLCRDQTFSDLMSAASKLSLHGSPCLLAITGWQTFMEDFLSPSVQKSSRTIRGSEIVPDHQAPAVGQKSSHFWLCTSRRSGNRSRNEKIILQVPPTPCAAK